MTSIRARRFQQFVPPPKWQQPIEIVVASWIHGINESIHESNASSWFGKTDVILRSHDLIIACHMELPGLDDATRWVDICTSAALDYFWGDWKDEPDVEDEESISAHFNMAEIRERPPRYIRWFQEFSMALIASTLSGRREAVSLLCDWPWADLTPEYSGMGGPLEDEYALMYLVVASGLRDSPMEGIDSVRARVRRCRQKRSRLLLDLWEAVEAGDQNAFNKAMTASLKHHDAGPGTNGKWTFVERVAEPQSIMHQVAIQRGLRPTDLPKNLEIYLVTRKSLGLAF